MKLIILSLMLATFVACTPSKSTDPTTPSPTASPTATPVVNGPQEPGEQPIKVVDGKKIGQIKLTNTVKLWKDFSWHGTAPMCSTFGAVSNQTCNNVDPGTECMLVAGSQQKMRCTLIGDYKVFGWVYEMTSSGVKPMSGVKIELNFWNGMGIVDRAVVATSNEFGYYEFTTNNLKNQILGSKDGYLASCGQKESGFPSNGVPLPQSTLPMVLINSSEACKQ